MKRKRSRSQTVLILIVLAMIVYLEWEEQRRQNTPPAPTGVALATLTPITPTATMLTAEPSATLQPTLLPSPVPTIHVTATPQATKRPQATDVPGLVITPISGTLYEITGTVNVLSCPDSRCKVVDVYKKRNIIVVTGIVMGTTYKKQKTRVWYQVIFHDGRKVYVHGGFAKPYKAT